MKIRMKLDVSGSRDGKAWPKRGEVADLPDDEAAQLCATGMALPVRSDEDVETRPDSEPAAKRTALTTQSASALVPNEGDQGNGDAGDTPADSGGDSTGSSTPAAADTAAKKTTAPAAKKAAAAKPAASK